MNRRPDRSLLVAILFFGCFLLLARSVQHGVFLEIDSSLAQLVGAWRTQPMTSLFRTLTTLGDGKTLLAVGLLSAALFAWRRRLVAAAAVVVGSAGAWGLTEGLKVSFLRPRPDWLGLPRLTEAIGFSFPSGHALNAVVIYGLLLLLVWPVLGKKVRGGVAAATVLLVVAIGCSRVYLGVHYASDVLGGWLMGLAWLCFCRAVLRRWAWRERRPPPEE